MKTIHTLHQDQPQSCELRNRIPTRALATVSLLLSQASCTAESAEEGDVFDKEQSVICDSDNRSAISALTFPRGAVGKLGGCSGVVVGPTKVLTAAHCIEGSTPQSLTFRPQFGIVTSGQGPLTAGVERYIQGMAWDNSEGTMSASVDWALLTLDTDLTTLPNYQEVSIAPLSGQSYQNNITLMGYHGDLYSNRPAREIGCDVNAVNSSALWHNCDVIGGASGGPILLGTHLVGIQSGHGNNCSGSQGNNTAADANMFVGVPDETRGLGTTYLSDGRSNIWATDSYNTTVVSRRKKSTGTADEWDPWREEYSGFGGAREMAGTNLQDSRQFILVVNQWGQLWSRWETSVGGSWSAWTSDSVPTTVIDVAATGGAGNRTQVFVLGSNGAIYTRYKTGDANSSWSTWQNLGTVSGAKALSAVRWNGMSVAFAAGSGGLKHTWGNDHSFSSLVSLGTSSYVAVSSALLADGRVHLHAVDSSGNFRTRVRLTTGSWAAWSTSSPSLPSVAGDLIALEASQLPGGREHVLAIAENREVYHVSEQASGSLESVWKRFYR